MSNRAWVTLATNDSYGLGALVLAHSLRHVSSAYPSVVLITPSVTEAMRERLRAVFAEVIIVDVLDSRDAAHLALLQRPELGITFTKIHCWNLTQYEKCVFLDADTLVVQNSDELFEREELSAAPDVGWPDCFNSGVFVFAPSNETFNRLIAFAQERGSFDGGDQGLLNSFFSDWARGDINKHLPFLYNVTSAAFYSYLPALKHYGQDLKIIHFIGAAKPWLQHFNFESRTVDAPDHIQGLLQLWWNIFVGHVHSQLDTAMSGVAGNLARVAGAASHEALDDLTRRQGWEAGNIDYMGADSFANIWAKISQTLSAPRTSPPKQPSPPKEPSPPASEQAKPVEPVEIAKEAVFVETPAVEPVVAKAPVTAPIVTPPTPVTVEAPVIAPAAPVEAPVVAQAAPVALSAVAPATSVATPAVAPSALAETPAVAPSAPVETPVVAPSALAETPAVAPSALAKTPAVAPSAPAETPVVTSSARVEVPAAPIVPPAAKELPIEKPVAPIKSSVEKPAPVEAPIAPLKPAPSQEPALVSEVAPSEIPATVDVPAAAVEVADPAEVPITVATAPEVLEKKQAAPKVLESKQAVESPKSAEAPASDSPPLASTPSKEEAPAIPAAKSEERRKPAGKLRLLAPVAADPLPTPDSEAEDAATLAQSIIAGELTPTVTEPTPPAVPASPPTLAQQKGLTVAEPEVPTPPVSLAQIGVKPKEKSTTAARIESSVAAATDPPTPAPADAPKKKVIKKVVKKDAAGGDAPVPPPRKKEKKPKEK